MREMIRKIALILLLGAVTSILPAQINDDFSKASEIKIENNGKKLGNFKSSVTDISKATIETNESFVNTHLFSGRNKKSIWYKFQISTGREAQISLNQNGNAISDESIGVSIYRNPDQIPALSKIERSFYNLTGFDSMESNCLKPGIYYIQVLSDSTAEGAIWINLNLDSSHAARYDRKKDAFDYINTRTYIPMGCHTTSKEDGNCHPADYTQSFWFTFSTQSKAPGFLEIQLFAGQTLKISDCYISLYKGNCRDTSSLLEKIVQCNKGWLTEDCGIDKGEYSVQVILKEDFTKVLYINLNMGSYAYKGGADPNNLNSYFNLGNVNSSSVHQVSEGLSCQSRMARYKCGNVIPKALPFNVKDSYDLHFLVTFTLQERASFRLEKFEFFPSSLTTGLARKFRLFKGHAPFDCRLDELTGENKSCLEPGNYTLQFLIDEKNGDSTCLGTLASTTFRFRRIIDQASTLFSNPNKPEFIGKIGHGKDSSDYNKKIYSSAEYFGTNDTFIKVGDKVLYGRFICREFYVPHPSRLKISEMDHHKTYLIQGRLKNGRTKLVDSKYGQHNPIYAVRGDWQSQCKALPKGWYSLLSLQSSRCKDLFTLARSMVEIEIKSTIKSNYNKPYKAHLIQNLEPITWTLDSTSKPKRILEKKYYLPYASSSCTPDLPIYLPSRCIDSEKNQVSYYVFKIDSPSFITTSPGYLFPFNIKTDSLSLIDSGSMINPCQGRKSSFNYYCNLQPGVYTLTILKTENDSIQPVLYASPILNVSNDFAKNAYDIGDLDSGLTSSPGERVSCQAGFSPTDYPIAERTEIKEWQSMTNLSAKSTAYSQSYHGNIWYTFTAEGTGRISFSPEGIFKNLSSKQFEIHLYEATTDPNIPFSELQAQNLIDSTEESGLIHKPFTYSFNKDVCATKRYFVVVSFPIISEDESLRPNFYFKLKIQFNSSNSVSTEGDFCSNAIPIHLDSNQTISASCDVSCHTMGNSYGENEVKLGCLGPTANRKTTWFKITYAGQEKTRLEIIPSGLSNTNSNQIRYRIISGNCDNTVVGSCSRGTLYPLSLECVHAGDYFVQISMPSHSKGKLHLQVRPIPFNDSFCTPFDSFGVHTYFYATGGCTTNDTIHFVNKSTEGDAIRYSWDFGDGNTSTQRSPSHLYNPTGGLPDSFEVSLTVKNTNTEKSEKFERKVFIYKNLSLTLPNDTFRFCSNDLQLKATSNFTPKNIEWFSSMRIYYNSTLNPIIYIIPSQGAYAYLTVQTQNCIFSDSVFITDRRPPIHRRQYSLCANETLILGNQIDTFPIFKWSSGETSDQIEISKSGNYGLSYGYREDCQMTDSFLVTEMVSPKVKAISDPVCIGDFLEVEPITSGHHSFTWQHEFNTDPITLATDTGWYYIKTDLGFCSNIDSFYIDPATFMHPNLTDTTLCRDKIMLKINLDDAVYKWNTGERTQQILVTEPGKYSVTVDKDGCQMKQNVKVRRSGIVDYSIADIIICDSTEKKITLDSSYQIRWYDGSTSFQRTFKELGTYQVDIIDHPCTLKTNVTIRETHNLYDQLGPDTAICLPVKIPLLFTHSYDSIWWSTGETGIPVVNIKDTGLFWVKIVRNGCLGIDSIYIDSLTCRQNMYVPNAFTPHGKNPMFLPKGVNLTDFEIKIYNRWSQLLFSSDDISKGWDGTHHNKDCPPNTYIYLINYKTTFGKSQFVSGRFNLIR